jgi:hypothetical protein
MRIFGVMGVLQRHSWGWSMPVAYGLPRNLDLGLTLWAQTPKRARDLAEAVDDITPLFSM